MTTECSSTADAITGVLMAGDAVLNLSQQPLNAIAGTLFVSSVKNQLSVSRTPTTVQWKPGMADALRKLCCDTVERIVVVSEENCSDAAVLIRELGDSRLPYLHCTLMNTCDEDSFMDAEDTEAVTERLRQLGYI